MPDVCATPKGPTCLFNPAELTTADHETVIDPVSRLGMDANLPRPDCGDDPPDRNSAIGLSLLDGFPLGLAGLDHCQGVLISTQN